MAKVELVGLPSVGKTTLLRSLNPGEYRYSRDAKPGRFSALLCLGSSILANGRDTDRFSMRSVVRDTWASGSFLEYPSLFSEVMRLSALVPTQHRQRAIVLNYWRERALTHSLLKAKEDNRLSVVDEGLIQTLLSTVLRIPAGSPLDPHHQEIVQRVVDQLPEITAIVYLRTSPDNVLNRLGFSPHWALRDITVDWIDLIIGALHRASVRVIEIDAANSPQVVLNEFLRATRML